MAEYKLPDVGEGLTEAEIVSWKVQVGDTVAVNDVVVEIETAKSLVELPSPYAGTVTALLVPEGETVAVGTPIIAIGDEAPAAADEPPAAPAPAQEQPEMDLSNPRASGGGDGESLVGRAPVERGAVRRARRGAAAPAAQSVAATQMQVQGAFAPGGAQSEEPSEPVVEADEPAVPAHDVREPAPAADARVLAKPPVRKLAKDLGVDLATLVATGPHGTVSRSDVEQAAASGSSGSSGSSAASGASGTPAATARAGTGERETREPVKGVRKMMAQAMSRSAFTAPHVTEWVTLDVTATVELVERLKGHRELREVRVSPLLVVAKAVLLALRRTPLLNSRWDEDAQEVVHRHYVNLGIAAATPRGLVVPNVKDADALSLADLARALADLTGTAREGRTQPAEMSEGTFTITNVGVFGVDAGTPIINPGESGILCFGAIRRQPWVVTRDGAEEVVPRSVTTLALSFDHRHVDGETGSRFLADVAAILEDPATALMF